VRDVRTGRTRHAAARSVAVALVVVLVVGAGLASGGCLSFLARKPAATKVKLVLYFGNKNADKVVREDREVVKAGKTIEVLTLEELIKGPARGDLARSVPAETRVLSVKVDKGIAYADFSKEIQTKHWGGSAGEAITINSIVASLTELPGIQKVQFLIEGKRPETLAGHAMLDQPIARNESFIQK
jgi:germination protein M